MFKDMFKSKIEGSLDIGSSSIKGLSLKNGEIERLEIKKLANGTILSGNIEDHLAVTTCVKEIVEELNLKNKQIVVSLPVQNFFVKFFQIIKVEEHEKQAMVEDELGELVPNYVPEEYITHFLSVGEIADKEEILAVTIQKEKIKDIIEILTSLKLKPVKIIPDFISLYNFLGFSKEYLVGEVENPNIMIVDIGSEATKIFIEKNGIIRMQRIAAIGGNDFTEVIERNLNMDYEKAELYKQGLELKASAELEEEDKDEIFEELGELIEELNAQIRRSIEYYKSQEGIPGLDAIVLTGGTALMKGYERILEEALMTEVKKFPIEQFFLENKEQQEMILMNINRFSALLGNIINEVKA